MVPLLIKCSVYLLHLCEFTSLTVLSYIWHSSNMRTEYTPYTECTFMYIALYQVHFEAGLTRSISIVSNS